MTWNFMASPNTWLVQLLLAAAIVAGQKPASPEQGPQYLNMVSWKAGSGLPVSSLLVADGFSLYSKGKALNNDGCKQLAMRLQGANAWAFCANKAGCGNACAAYTKANPTLPIGNKSPVGRAYWSRPLPVKGVGYWTYPRAGLKGCALDAKGKPTDKWAFGTCRILKVADAKKPQLQSKAAGAGWLYGTIVRDAKCGSLLSSTCAACMRSTNPLSCLACSKGFYVKPANALLAMLAPTLDAESAQQSACVRCAAMPYGTTTYRCIQCVAKRKPCGACAITKYAPDQATPTLPDLPSCINCAWDENLASISATPYLLPAGTRNIRTREAVCRECASRPTAQRQQCMPCLKAFARLCPHDGDTLPSNIAYQKKFGFCRRPGVTLSDCDLAYKMQSATFTQCVKLGRAVECINSCLGVNNMAGVCMNCVNKNEKPDCRSCIESLDSNPDYSVLNDFCQACWVDKAVIQAAKDQGYCDTCSNMNAPYYAEELVDEDFCNACIRNPATTDLKTCVRYISTGYNNTR